MVLTRDLKDAYKSGKFSSSKVKRSVGSVEEFKETRGGAATDTGTTDTEEWVGPDTVQTDAGAELGVQEKVETDTDPGLAGKDGAASEKEGAAGEVVDMLAADRGVAETVGMEKVGPVGRGGGKELMEDMGAAGGSPAEGETDGWGTGRLDTGLGM